MADNFIVAIELGSSKVTAIAGLKQPDGAVEILAFAQEPSTTFIRKGRINNVSKMTQCITSMKDKLEQKLQKRISRVYVGIAGMGMHTIANTVVRNFESKIEITPDIVDALSDENRSSATPDRDILEAIPQEFRLGTQQTQEPVGVLAADIEARFLNIVASSAMREEIRGCFQTAHTNIADLPITVLTLADLVLTEPEKRSGCVFVDMGAETTSVAIYKNNILRHLAVIPLGGANITRDIMSLQIEEDEAEALKLQYGTAIAPDPEEGHAPINLRDGRQVPFNEFAGLVEARTEEIVLNIKHQIELSSYDSNTLIGGLVVTGGAAHMKDISKAFEAETKFEKIRFVRKLNMQLRTGEYKDFNKDGDCNSALALIDKGGTNCCGGDLDKPAELFEEEKQPAEPIRTPEEIAAEEAEAERQRLEAEAAEAERQRQEEAEAKRQQEEEERRRKKAERKKKIFNIFKRAGDKLADLVSEKE